MGNEWECGRFGRSRGKTLKEENMRRDGIQKEGQKTIIRAPYPELHSFFRQATKAISMDLRLSSTAADPRLVQ